MISKKKTAAFFNKSLAAYHRHAIVQKKSAECLYAYIKEKCGQSFQTIYEIGCGTGFLTSQLAQLAYERYYTNDIADGAGKFIHNIDKEIIFQTADGEINDPPADNINLAASSAVFQWFDDLRIFMNKISAFLTPGGILAFSLFGPDNMREIKELTSIGLEYLSMETIQSFQTESMSCILAREEKRRIHFINAPLVFSHCRKTGVNSLSDSAWTKDKLRQLYKSYEEKYSDLDGVYLSYHPMYFIFKKAGS